MSGAAVQAHGEFATLLRALKNPLLELGTPRVVIVLRG
jgi:hypothetical protein